MSDAQISQLPSLPGAELAAEDLVAVVDNSASETKRISAKEFVEKGVSLIDAGSIPGSALATLGTDTVVTASIADGNVTNAKLLYSGFNLGGLTIYLGSTDPTPSFDLTDATNYPASSLTGTITNAQLAGSIANNKLAHSSISLGGVSINLGETNATPVFDLTNATNYPASSLTGTITNSQLAGSIANNKLAHSSISLGGVSISLGGSDSNPSFDLTDATNYPTSSLTGTITNAQLAGSIQGSKILSGSISSTELGSNSVTAVELANLSVDTAALIDSSVTNEKISGVSGTKVAAGSLPATALNTSNLGTGLAVSNNNLVIDNTVAAATATKVTFSSEGLITSSASLAPSDLPIADATNVGGVSIGGGLAITGAGALSLSNSITAATVSGIQFNAFGQIVSATNLVSSDLPISNSSQVGGVKITVGGGLSVDGSGGLSTSSSGISGGTYTKLTVNSKGVATAGTVLAASDIPDIPANKISSGTIDAARIASSSIAGVKLSDASTTIFGGPDSTTNITSFPSEGDFKGQRFWDEYTQDEYIWTGASWTAITTTAGELTLLGTYSASDNTLSSVTTEGGAAGLTATAALPDASAQNKQGYVVVDDTGTGTSPAPTVTLNAPDYLLSDGSAWKHIDVSGAMAATAATQVSVNTFAHGGSTDIVNTVQASLENLATNRLRKSGGDITGALTIKEAGSLVFEGTDANSATTTLSVVDPDANRTINLPNTSGTLITSGDSDTVTSTMVDSSLTHSNLASNAAIAFSQLAALTSASILIGNANGVVAETTVTGDISITDAGVTSIGAGKIDDAMVSTTAAIDGSKIAAATTLVVGTVKLYDSTDSTSTSLAATANALKTAYDKAVEVDNMMPLAGGTFTDDVTFTGATSDGSWSKTSNAFVADLQGNVTGNLTGRAYITTQNTTHGASRLALGHEGSSVSQIRAYGADASTKGTLEFKFTTSDGSANDPDITFAAGGATFGGQVNAKKLVLSDDQSASPIFLIKTDDANPWAFNIKNDNYATSEDVGLKAYQANGGDFYLRLQGSSEYTAFYFRQHDGTTERDLVGFGTDQSATFAGNVTINSPAHDGGLSVLAGGNNQETRINLQGKAADGTAHDWIIGASRSADKFYVSNTTTTLFSISDSGAATFAGRVGIGADSGTVDSTALGASLVVRQDPIDRNAYYSPEGSYFAAFGPVDETHTKAWLSIDSAYSKAAAVSAGIFLRAYHADAGGNQCGYTIKNLKADNALVFSSVVTGATTSHKAVETEKVRFASDGTVTFAEDIKLSSATAKILGTTADASDNGQININAGGSASQTRGAGDAFYGNEHASFAGKRYVMAGNVSGGDIEFYTQGTVSATIAYDGNATFEGSVSDSIGNLRSIPYSDETGSTHTLLATDRGKLIGANNTVEIPASVLGAGDAVTILCHSATAITLEQGTGLTLYNSADGNTGDRSLAARGMATVYFVSNTIAYISGSGLS